MKLPGGYYSYYDWEIFIRILPTFCKPMFISLNHIMIGDMIDMNIALSEDVGEQPLQTSRIDLRQIRMDLMCAKYGEISSNLW